MKRFLAILALSALALSALAGCATVQTSSVITSEGEKAGEGDEKAIKALISDLRSPDRAVKDKAYQALILAGSPAVPDLIALLKDKDPDMQEYAAGILGNIGDERAAGPLLKMLESPGPRRYIAAWALGKMKNKKAIGPLVKVLGEKNEALQKEATRALIAIGPDSVPALIEALDSPVSDVRKYAVRALGIIADKRAEEPLIRLLSDKDNEVAAAAALALGTAGTERSIKPLVDALGSSYMLTRVNASIALGQLEAKEAVDPLTEIMEKDHDPYVREWSARALENITGNRYKYKDENGAMVFPYNLYR